MRRVIQRYTERGTVKLHQKGLRPTKVGTPKVLSKIQKFVNTVPDISERVAATRLGLAKSTYSDLKVKKLNIRSFVKEDVPRYKEGQAERAKTACRKIYRKKVLSGGEKIVIMDDETYVPVNRSEIHGKEYYNARVRGDVSDEFRFKPRQKFPEKFLVWQAIDERGNVSNPYIQKGTMNAETYLNECLKKRLLPFINRYHPDRRILFWPDMARIHYTGAIKQWLAANGIDFLDYGENAPSVWDKCDFLGQMQGRV